MKRGRVAVAAIVLLALAGAVAVARPWQSAPAPQVAAERERLPDRVRVRVEVLNTGGVSGLAGDATDLLRSGGFDVVDYGNAAEWTEDSSSVIDRVGRPELAEAVATRLGIHNVLSRPDTNLYVDVSVMLGKEWAAPETGTAPEEASYAWWDPRGWFRR